MLARRTRDIARTCRLANGVRPVQVAHDPPQASCDVLIPGAAGVRIVRAWIIIGFLLLTTACSNSPRMSRLPPMATRVSSPSPPLATTPLASTATSKSSPSPLPATTPPPVFTATWLPTRPPLPSSTLTPSLTPVLTSVTPMPPRQVSEARAVYHDGFFQDGVGYYEEGTVPWLDLLVRLDKTWYGPEREAGDGLEALPLPASYRWEALGGFGTLPNGEAWWNQSATEGMARLIGPADELLLELPLRIVFLSGQKAPPPSAQPTLPPT